jgi:hypothetical protein
MVFVALDGLLSQAREMQNQPLSQAREKRPRGSFLAVQARAGTGEWMGSPPVFSREGRKCKGGEEQRRKSSAGGRADAEEGLRGACCGAEEGRCRRGGEAARGGCADVEEARRAGATPIRPLH